MIGGLVVLAGFVQLQRSPKQTLIDLELFRARGFTWGTILATIVSFALFGMMFTLPQFYQAVEGADAFGTGLRLLPLIAGMVVGVRGGQQILKKVSSRMLIGVGFALLTVALLIGSTTGVHDGYGYVASWLTLGGVGSGLLMTIRQIGGTVAVAILGTVLNSQYRSHLAQTTAHLPADQAAAVTRSAGSGVAVAAKEHSASLLEAVRSALVHATSTTMWVSAAFAVFGVLAATQLPRRAPVPAAAPKAAESSRDLLNAAD
jgi:hypothetical protein